MILKIRLLLFHNLGANGWKLKQKPSVAKRRSNDDPMRVKGKRVISKNVSLAERHPKTVLPIIPGQFFTCPRLLHRIPFLRCSNATCVEIMFLHRIFLASIRKHLWLPGDSRVNTIIAMYQILNVLINRACCIWDNVKVLISCIIYK